ncbi:MAG: hypothetical protein C0631_09140 [Sedimenticola sp.]|mgnify:CR=1 FL=1|jgi:predicted DNA-binding protein|nr:MAG: hypothetical protein C0631_09140 [Sedimenticola sp.]
MWPFFKNKQRTINLDPLSIPQKQEPRRRPLTLDQLMDHMGDISDLFEDDVALKFWLPDPADQAIRELAKHYGMTMSRMLRNFLVVHCYGLYVFEWIRANHPDDFLSGDSDIRFSLRVEEPSPGKVRVTTYWVPELGKNIKPVKLWIPTRLKEDLGLLAEHAGLTPSNYVREITIARFMGHGTLPMRPEMLEADPTAAAEDWNEDRDVPWREASLSEYKESEAGKLEREWVDENSEEALQAKLSD